MAASETYQCPPFLIAQELDKTLGDIHSNIVDFEQSIRRELVEGVLEYVDAHNMQQLHVRAITAQGGADVQPDHGAGGGH